MDDIFDNAYGIKNVTTEGIPANNVSVPYEIKQVMTDVLSASRRRGVGMEGSAFIDRPKHGTSQVLGSTSGKNYREFSLQLEAKGTTKKNTYKYAAFLWGSGA